MGAFYNADALYVPDLVRNINSDLTQLFHWNFSRAASFIDILIFYIIGVFFDSHISIFVFSIIQISLTTLLVFIVYKSFFTFDQAAVFTSLSILFLGIIVTQQYHPFFVVMKTAHHYLEFLICVFSLYCFNCFLDKGEKKNMLFVFAFFQSLSDQLYLIHFVLPCLIWSGMVWNNSESAMQKRILVFASQFILVILVATFIHHFLNNNIVHPEYKIDQLFDPSIEKINVFLAGLLNKYPTIFILSCLFYLGGTITYFKSDNKQIWLPFLLLSLTVTLTVLVLSDRNVLGRYMLPYLFAPILFSFCCIPQLAKKIPKKIGVLIIVLVSIGLVWSAPRKEVNGAFYPNHVNCIDTSMEKLGVINLVGDYWAARHYSFLSKKIQVDPYKMNFSKDLTVNNTQRFNQNYSGFIVNSIDGRGFKQEKIEKRFGMAEQIIDCHNASVMIYPVNSIVLNSNNKLIIK